MLSFGSSGYVFFPGGYGTLDEFFEMITLIQTKKISQDVVVVAVDKEFWEPLFSWLRSTVCQKYKAIKEENLDIFKLVDTPEEALEIIKENFESKDKK